MIFILIILLALVSYYDAKTLLIKDSYNIAIAFFGVLYIFMRNNTLQNGLLSSFIGASILFIIDRLTIIIAKKEGFGYGDMKLLLALGLFISPIQMIFLIFFSVIIASFFAIYLIYKKYEYMPFGPFLCAGFILSYFEVHLYFISLI